MVATLLEGMAVIVLAGLGIADAWRLSYAVRAGGIFHDVIGPDRYLAVVSGGLLACGVIYLLSGLRQKQRGEAPREEAEGVQTRQVVVVSVILVIYALAFPVVGYLVATVLFFPVTFFIFGVRPWPKSAWVGVLTAVLFYVMFYHFAEIPLPRGFLELPF